MNQGLDPDDPASYHLLNDVAVVSPLLLTEAAVPEFRKAGGGTVVRRVWARPA